MLNVVLVDDEAKARKSLSLVLARYPDVRIVAEAANGMEAIDVVAAHHPDIIFLDVKMPGMSGFDVLDKLDENEHNRCRIIFMTAYDEFAIKAIKYAAFDYLLKPVDIAELDSTLQRLKNETTNVTPNVQSLMQSLSDNNKFRVKTNQGYEYINYSDIIYIEGLGNYSTIIISGSIRHTISKTLKEISTMLPSSFLRIHRKYIANAAFAASFRKSDFSVTLTKENESFVLSVSVRMYRKLRPGNK